MGVHRLKQAEFDPDATCPKQKARGDIVRLGANRGPEYEIVAIEGGTAWVREPVTFANECLAPLARLHFVRRPAQSVAKAKAA